VVGITSGPNGTVKASWIKGNHSNLPSPLYAYFSWFHSPLDDEECISPTNTTLPHEFLFKITRTRS